MIPSEANTTYLESERLNKYYKDLNENFMPAMAFILLFTIIDLLIVICHLINPSLVYVE